MLPSSVAKESVSANCPPPPSTPHLYLKQTQGKAVLLMIGQLRGSHCVWPGIERCRQGLVGEGEVSSQLLL